MSKARELSELADTITVDGSGNLDVSGSVTSDGLTVDGVETPTISLTDNSTSKNLLIRVDNAGGELSTSTTSNDDLRFSTNRVPRLRLEHNGDISFYEDTGTTPKFFWDASAESLGIGTTSPTTGKLVVKTTEAFQPALSLESEVSNGEVGIRFFSNNATPGINYINFGDTADSNVGQIAYRHNVDAMTFQTSDSEAMRIDSSGNLLVGCTAAGEGVGNTNTGATVGSFFSMSRDGGTVGYFNRNTSDGDIVQFRRAGTQVGSIGVISNDLFIGTTDVSTTDECFLRFAYSGIGITPAGSDGSPNDNALDLGQSVARFNDIYATNGTIQTSDRNEKQDIEELSDAEQRVAVAAKGLLRKYRWKDAVAEKGDAARIHFGIIAQDLQAAFEAEGLDVGRYGMFISSTWWETTETYTDDEGVEQTRTNTYATQEEAPEGATERTRMGVRYPELLAFIIAAI